MHRIGVVDYGHLGVGDVLYGQPTLRFQCDQVMVRAQVGVRAGVRVRAKAAVMVVVSVRSLPRTVEGSRVSTYATVVNTEHVQYILSRTPHPRGAHRVRVGVGARARLGLGLGLGLGVGLKLGLGLGVGVEIGIGLGLASELELGCGLGSESGGWSSC